MADRASLLRAASPILLAAVIPLAWRATVLPWCVAGPWDLRGACADLGAGLLVGSLALGLATRVWWGLGAVLLVLWNLVSYAVIEHVRELNAHPLASNLHYLTDPTFFSGSALAFSHPVLLLVFCLAPFLTCRFVRSGSVNRRTLWGGLIGAAACAVLTTLIPVSGEAPTWRQRSGLPAMAIDPIRRTLSNRQWEAAWDLHATAELTGMPRIETSGQLNVLLLILEGVSGVHLDAIARREGFRDDIHMARLDGLAAKNWRFVNFVAQQRQTNRGTYAILAGRPPRLTPGEANMTLIARGGHSTPMLPAVLRDAGYATVYLQSAPLAFMHKDEFMRLAGFERILGDRQIRRSERYGWGVDDPTLFDHAREQIERLESPWFLTVMTAGTHHPYIVPPDRPPPDGVSRRAHAFDVLDEACTTFLSRLEADGRLENTLVIITSDESAGRPHCADWTRARLAPLCGFAIAMIPHAEPASIDQIYAQSDIAVSITDLLKIDGTPFSGRSLFRSYDSSRNVVFANTYQATLGAFGTDGYIRFIDGWTGREVGAARFRPSDVWSEP